MKTELVVGTAAFLALLVGCSAAPTLDDAGESESAMRAPPAAAGPGKGNTGPWGLTPDYKQCIPFDVALPTPGTVCGGADGSPHYHAPVEHPDLARNPSTSGCAQACANQGGELIEVHFPTGKAGCTLATATAVFGFSACRFNNHIPPEFGRTELKFDEKGKPIFPSLDFGDAADTTSVCHGHQGATGGHQGPGNLPWTLYDACLGVVAKDNDARLPKKTTAECPKEELQDAARWCSETAKHCTEISKCGDVGEPTCVSSQSSGKGWCNKFQEPQADADSVTGYICPPCGDVNEVCCGEEHPAGQCTGNYVCGQNGICEEDLTCGHAGEPCCEGTPSCKDGSTCNEDTSTCEFPAMPAPVPVKADWLFRSFAR